MAGGVKKPVNIFKLKDLEVPKQVFNWRLVSHYLSNESRGPGQMLPNFY